MSTPMDKYDEFFSLVYSQGVLDAKMKYLIALGASLGAGCQPWTEFSLAVARQNGASEDEINETVTVAMTIGAHKVMLMAGKSASSNQERDSLQTDESKDAGCVTWQAWDIPVGC